MRRDRSVADRLAREFPAGVMTRDGGVVGAYLPVGFVVDDAVTGDRIGFRAAWRGIDGHPRHARTAFSQGEVHAVEWAAGLVGPGPDDGHPASDFGGAIREMLDLRFPSGEDNLCHAMLSVLAGTRERIGADRQATRRHVARLAEWVTPFLTSLDPEALRFAGTFDGFVHLRDQWDGIDATFTPGAPLRAALERYPFLFQALRTAWSNDRAEFVSSISEADHLALARRATVAAGSLDARLARHLGEAHDRYRDMVGTWPPSVQAVSLSGRLRADQPVRLLQPLRHMPGDWVPIGDDWDPFFDSTSLFDRVARLCGPTGPGDAHKGGLFKAGQGWGAWLRKLAKAARIEANPIDATLAVAIGQAVADVSDMAEAMRREIVAPALALGSGMGRGHAMTGQPRSTATKACLAILCSGRGLPRILDMSRRWHASNGLIRRAVSNLSGGEASTARWRPALPPHSAGDLSLVILDTLGALLDEGADHVDALDASGLSHCIGGYAHACLSGGTRIASIRRTLPGGAYERLSTVEFSFAARGANSNGTCLAHVEQHRGRRNAMPPPLAERFLRSYVRDVLSVASIPAADLTPIPERHDTAAEAGYAWWENGHWAAAERAWAPHLPPAARGLGPGRWASWIEALTAEEAKAPWRPAPLRPPGPVHAARQDAR